MRANIFFVAQKIEAQDPGLIITGPITTTRCSQFPSAATLSVMFSLEFDSSECGIHHSLQIQTRSPDNQVGWNAKLTSQPVPPHPYDGCGELTWINPVKFQFPSEGVFYIELLVDNQIVATVKHYVVLASRPLPDNL